MFPNQRYQAGVKALEQQLGVQLLSRGSKRAALTVEGEYFLSHAKKIIEEFTIAKAKLKLAPPSNRVNLGVFPTFTISRLAALLKAINDNESKLGPFQIYEGNQAKLSRMLGQSKIDVIFTVLSPNPNDNPEFTLSLFEETYALIVHESHPLARKKSVHIRQLHGQSFILRTHCENLKNTRTFFLEKQCEPNIICRTGQDNWAFRLVEARNRYDHRARLLRTYSQDCATAHRRPPHNTQDWVALAPRY